MKIKEWTIACKQDCKNEERKTGGKCCADIRTDEYSATSQQRSVNAVTPALRRAQPVDLSHLPHKGDGPCTMKGRSPGLPFFHLWHFSSSDSLIRAGYN